MLGLEPDEVTAVDPDRIRVGRSIAGLVRRQHQEAVPDAAHHRQRPDEVADRSRSTMTLQEGTDACRSVVAWVRADREGSGLRTLPRGEEPPRCGDLPSDDRTRFPAFRVEEGEDHDLAAKVFRAEAPAMLVAQKKPGHGQARRLDRPPERSVARRGRARRPVDEGDCRDGGGREHERRHDPDQSELHCTFPPRRLTSRSSPSRVLRYWTRSSTSIEK